MDKKWRSWYWSEVRRAIGRPIFGFGYWLIHGRSAWDEPDSSRYTFNEGVEGADPQEIAKEAAAWERSRMRGAGRRVWPGELDGKPLRKIGPSNG